MSIVHNARQYLTFGWREFFDVMVTAFFAAFVVSFNEWGEESFDVTQGLTVTGLTFVFLLFIFIVTVWCCKVVAIRMGYVVEYRPHVFGLVFGVIVTVASAGYLPLFLPGGFHFERPERLRIGHWRGYLKGWEMGVVVATFPLLMLLWVLLLNPLYLASGEEFYLHLITAAILTAIFSLIPAPMIGAGNTGRASDFFASLRGSSFGLDIIWVSKYWYAALAVFVLLFAALAWVLTLVGYGVGLAIYVIMLLLAIIGTFVYWQFFKQ